MCPHAFVCELIYLQKTCNAHGSCMFSPMHNQANACSVLGNLTAPCAKDGLACIPTRVSFGGSANPNGFCAGANCCGFGAGAHCCGFGAAAALNGTMPAVPRGFAVRGLGTADGFTALGAADGRTAAGAADGQTAAGAADGPSLSIFRISGDVS